ncbi:MAG: XRE family transcriptional regulator [Proteobacteria bacterium]|nr:XRE family transcriptional regulator [Pseudomonadota bacterium]
MRNEAWATYVKEKRKTRHLTRRKLAELAKIDPSYVTLIERDGYVPRKDKVLELARALEVDVDHTLLVAGYAPEKVSLKDLLDRLEAIHAEKSMDRELRTALREVIHLPKDKQKELGHMIMVHLHPGKEEVGRGKKANVAGRAHS